MLQFPDRSATAQVLGHGDLDAGDGQTRDIGREARDIPAAVLVIAVVKLSDAQPPPGGCDGVAVEQDVLGSQLHVTSIRSCADLEL